MASVRIKRGTRAQIDAAAAANQLAAGEPYLITDEAKLAVGLAANTYQAQPLITVGTTAPATPSINDIWIEI